MDGSRDESELASVVRERLAAPKSRGRDLLVTGAVRLPCVVTTPVDGVCGVAHDHLPATDDDRPVGAYASVFDRRIELGRATAWYQL